MLSLTLVVDDEMHVTKIIEFFSSTDQNAQVSYRYQPPSGIRCPLSVRRL